MLCEVCDLGFSHLIPEVIQGMSQVLTTVLQQTWHFLLCEQDVAVAVPVARKDTIGRKHEAPDGSGSGSGGVLNMSPSETEDMSRGEAAAIALTPLLTTTPYHSNTNTNCHSNSISGPSSSGNQRHNSAGRFDVDGCDGDGDADSGVGGYLYNKQQGVLLTFLLLSKQTLQLSSLAIKRKSTQSSANRSTSTATATATTTTIGAASDKGNVSKVGGVGGKKIAPQQPKKEKGKGAENGEKVENDKQDISEMHGEEEEEEEGEAGDDSAAGSQCGRPRDWLLDVLPLSHRSALLSALIRVLGHRDNDSDGDCDDDGDGDKNSNLERQTAGEEGDGAKKTCQRTRSVFDVFHEQQMKLSRGVDTIPFTLSAEGGGPETTTTRLVQHSSGTYTPTVPQPSSYLSTTLPLPPTVVPATLRGGSQKNGRQKDSHRPMPLFCERLVEWACSLSQVMQHQHTRHHMSAPDSCSERPSEENHSKERRRNATIVSASLRLQHEAEVFRALVVQFCVTLLSSQQPQRAVQCLLGSQVTSPLLTSTLLCGSPSYSGSGSGSSSKASSDRKAQRKQALLLFSEHNQPALHTLKLLVELCWSSVLVMDTGPPSAPAALAAAALLHPNYSSVKVPLCAQDSTVGFKEEDTASFTTSVGLTHHYYHLKASLIKDCATLFEYIHACLCTPTHPASGILTTNKHANNTTSAVTLTLAELTRVAACSDLFANLLFRIYKCRVHSWVKGEREGEGDVGAFEGVMDVYEL